MEKIIASDQVFAVGALQGGQAVDECAGAGEGVEHMNAPCGQALSEFLVRRPRGRPRAASPRLHPHTMAR